MEQALEVFRQYGFLFTILGGVVAAMGLAFAIYKATHDRQIRFLNDRIRHLDQELADARKNGDPVILKEQNRQLLEKIGQLQNDLGAANANKDTLQKQCGDIEAEVKTVEAAFLAERDASQQKIDALGNELETQKEILVGKDRVERRRENQVRHALKLEGKIWQRKVLKTAPKFLPLHERHAAIVSVVNLKGGVGKTTITAHLAMALSSRGYRVLMVDLDLQGSLSTLFVNETILRQKEQAGLLLQHFLTKLADRQRAKLLDYSVPVLDGNASIVPTTDSLGYAESSLAMQWQLGYGKRDVRFLLRRGLHQQRVAKQFDIVLLDCPPILNACCLNALAASDYVLIPSVPSRSAAIRVPLLLNKLQMLKPFTNANVDVLGVLLNRTHGTLPSQWERDLWNTTLTESQNVWKLPVYSFPTSIRQMTEVRDMENEFARPEVGSELHGVFSKIVDELEKRLPNDCRRVPNTLV